MSAVAELSPRPLAAQGGRAPAPAALLAGVGACLALAASSAALLPTVPSYDPWSWIVWGREVVDPHLGFAVGGGPSWKPLPVIFTTVWALFGGAAPTLWVITARAGGLLGLLAAFWLCRRLVPGPRWAALVAGALAAAGIVLTRDWIYYWLRGTSEPILIATSLWAVERHLAGRRGSAFVLGVATSLLRPEAWPFVLLYAAWLWLREPRLRALVAAGLASIPFFWFVPPWVGSGQPFLAATHAHEYNGHLGSHPFLEVVRRGVDLQPLPALVLALCAVGLVALRGRDRGVLTLGALAAGWWVVVVGMTLDGYPGLERFFLPAAGAACVLGGVAVARLGLLAPIGGRAGGAALVGALGLGVAAISLPWTDARAANLATQEQIASHAVTRLDQLSAAAAAVGGHHGVYPCHSSFAAVNHSVQTALAWKLHVTLGRVGTSMRHQGLMFVGPHDSIDGGEPRIDPRLTERRLIARVGVWRVYRMTSPGSDTRCVGG